MSNNQYFGLETFFNEKINAFNGISGDLTGNVSGNVVGDVTGNVVGNVTGNLTGNVSGNVTGNLAGNVTGNLVGIVTGNVTGNLVGNVDGNVTSSGISTFTNGPVFIGAATSTGTASQRLQVTGNAYISNNLGIGITNPQFQLQTTSNALINGQYLVDRYMGYWNDPGSYSEYMLLGRNNSADVFRLLGSIYGNRGAAGERNVFFNICCSKTSFPASSYVAGNRIGSATFSLVTLTYSGNSWLALQSTAAVNTGGLNLYFTGQIYHSYSSTQWTHQDFYGSPASIPTGSVSSVTVLSSF